MKSAVLIVFLHLFLYCSFLVTIPTIRADDNDISLFTYTEKGEIAQLIYASHRISKGNPTVAFIDSNCNISCIVSFSEQPSSLYIKKKLRMEYDRDLKTLCLVSGYQPDCAYILREYNSYSQTHRLLYSEAPPIDSLSSHLSRWITRGLYTDNEESRISRPLAASILITKYDEHQQRVRLTCVENTGHFADYKYFISGSISPTRKELIKSILSNPSKIESKEIDDLVSRIVNVLDILEDELSSGPSDCELCLLSEHGAVRSSYEGVLGDKNRDISKLVNSLFVKQTPLKATS